jgi:hypothetical protein
VLHHLNHATADGKAIYSVVGLPKPEDEEGDDEAPLSE